MFDQPRLDRAPSVSRASDFHNVIHSKHPTLFSMARPAARSSTSNRQTISTSVFAAGNCFFLRYAVCFAHSPFAISLLQLKPVADTGSEPVLDIGLWYTVQSCAGRLVIEIFEDLIPTTARHLMNRCREGMEDTFKNTSVHKLIPDLAAFGGLSQG